MSLIQICEASEGYTTVDVPSHSDPELAYTCVVQEPDAFEDVICECAGYINRGYCRHQNEALELLCNWREGMTPEQSRTERGKYICPRCLGPTILVDA